MDVERWHRIESLFERALEMAESERGHFLDKACIGDTALHRELTALLAGSPTWQSQVRSALAKLLAPIARFERRARTVTGTAMFTPEYASPEQARGDAVSTASDVYSVGAVLYELMTGQPPLRPTGNALERLQVICEIDPPRPSTVGPSARRRELAGDVDNIILKALHKDPAQRYSSMEQLSDELGRWLDGLPVRARTSTVGYRAGKFMRRRWRALVLSALAVAVLVGATATSLRQASQIKTEQLTREQLQIVLDKKQREITALEREIVEARDALVRAQKAAFDAQNRTSEAATLLERALGTSQPAAADTR